MRQLPDELLSQLGRLAAGEGVELVAVELTGATRRPVVRLVLDRPGGVTLADCEQVSRQASVLLDTYDPFPGSYALEVSSPGLDRKLYGERDYVRFAGEMVKVRMRPGWRGARIGSGVLVGMADGAVRIRDAAGTEQELPIEGVFEVRLEPFAERPEPAPKGKRKQR